MRTKQIQDQDVLYSKGNNDCCGTPRYGVIPILKYLPKDKIIWCPCDTEDSEYVKVLKENGYNVIYSHIDYGQDYFKYEPEKWDIMVTNPFYTGKREVVQRALDFGKPFALLLPLTWLNDSAPVKLFFEKDLQLLMFDKRIKFINNGIVQNKITFKTAYYCYNLLPKQIIMEKLETN